MPSGVNRRSRVKSANDWPLTRDTTIAARLKPVLLYDQRVPGGKFSARCRLTISRTCAWVWTRVVRGQPAIAATLPRSRRPLVCVSMWRIVSGPLSRDAALLPAPDGAADVAADVA